jgi:hypothetical protein
LVLFIVGVERIATMPTHEVVDTSQSTHATEPEGPAAQPALEYTIIPPAPEPEPEPEPEPIAEPEPVAELEPAPPVPVTKAMAPKVEVTFVIPGVTSAQIQTGSRSLPYNHVAMTKLAPGRYIVRWRESADEPWHRSGTLNVQALRKGSYYEVRLGPKDIHPTTRAGGSAQ